MRKSGTFTRYKYCHFVKIKLIRFFILFKENKYHVENCDFLYKRKKIVHEKGDKLHHEKSSIISAQKLIFKEHFFHDNLFYVEGI